MVDAEIDLERCVEMDSDVMKSVIPKAIGLIRQTPTLSVNNDIANTRNPMCLLMLCLEGGSSTHR